MSVRVERQGAITTVVLSRPQARNAVDPATAKGLADAFRAFDADPEASVAVLFGEGGTFCAGARGVERAVRAGEPPVPPDPMRVSRFQCLAFGIIGVVGALLYGFTLPFPFVFDDYLYLVDNPIFRDSRSFGFLGDFVAFANYSKSVGLDPDLSTNFILRMANTDMRSRSQPCLKRLMLVVP